MRSVINLRISFRHRCRIVFILAGVFVSSHFCFSAKAESSDILQGSVLNSSLAFPGEVFVISSDELSDRRINSLEDILDLAPGVSYSRKGPTGSVLYISVEGRPMTGVQLLLNGHPMDFSQNIHQEFIAHLTKIQSKC